MKIIDDIQEMVRLESRISETASDDERQDLLVQKKLIRGRSYLVSIIYSIIDIHSRYPLLLPIVAASLALKFFY